MLNIMTGVRLRSHWMWGRHRLHLFASHTRATTHTHSKCTWSKQKKQMHVVKHTPERKCIVWRHAEAGGGCAQAAKHTQTQVWVRQSRWRRIWQASLHCAPTIRQAFLYHPANMFSPSHTNTQLAHCFLSPFQSSIILSPHRHWRQWEVEWGKSEANLWTCALLLSQ